MLYNSLEKILKKNKYNFFHIHSTTSTMDDTKEYLNISNKNCVFLSDKQTAGKGRRGRTWESPLGNIYCSISFNNFLKIKDHFLFSILIAVSIKMALEKLNVKEIYFKWPNDIFYRNKKFSGIIAETLNINKLGSYIVMGFGINVDNSSNIKKYSATYLKSFCDIENIENFLIIFFKILFINLNHLSNNKKILINFFSQFLMFKSESIKILLPDNSIISGVFIDINQDGSLRLQNNNNFQDIYNGSILI